MNQCPSGFGCLQTTPSAGVCWPGLNGGGGGGCSSDGGHGTMVLGLAFAALLIKRKRK
jgi:hypothetical protein